MISSYEKLRLPDENKLQDLILEVNWNPYDKKTNECKYVRVTAGGKTSVIKKEHLNAALFAIGNEEEQRKMIPQIQRRSRWYETVVSVKANNDIKKGENITFPIKLTLPTFEEEVIAEVKKDVIEGRIKSKKQIVL